MGKRSLHVHFRDPGMQRHTKKPDVPAMLAVIVLHTHAESEDEHCFIVGAYAKVTKEVKSMPAGSAHPSLIYRCNLDNNEEVLAVLRTIARDVIEARTDIEFPPSRKERQRFKTA